MCIRDRYMGIPFLFFSLRLARTHSLSHCQYFTMSLTNAYTIMKQRAAEEKVPEKKPLPSKPKESTQDTRMLTDGLTDRGGVDTKPPDKKTQMIRNARARADKWSTKEIYEPDHLEIMKHGTMPVAHTNHFDFRQREKEKELSNDPFNVLKHYLPDKERAHKTQEMHSSLFLQREPFNPMMTGTKMMRQRDPIKELGPSMRYGVRTENERIVRELQRNSSLDHNVIQYTLMHLSLIHI
eukprot:TRINITY_DN12081_c0_g1_i5.p1 TRINITY_DN12081_c0_g1~~TRINITY_DN12081_c0_g1_i5.p1  ORF type:complete len:260 (+),score=58.00 TRINITY_DN12081_c0_g1_i5:69-782(+)